MTEAPLPTYTRRQRVHSLAFVGPTFERDWSEKATIVGRHESDGGHWYVIRFDDGSMISSHASRLMAANEPAFRGRLPSYRSTQSRRCSWDPR